MKPSLSTLALLLLGYTLVVQADSTHRCGSHLVSLDDSANEVEYKCGTPVDRSLQGYKEISDRYGRWYEVPVEEWIYGPKNGMYHALRFEGGRLRKIDSYRGN